MPSRPAGVAFLADRDISALYRLYFTTSTKKSRRWGWKGGQKTSKRSFIYTEENNEKTGGEDPAFLTAHALAPGGDGDDTPGNTHLFPMNTQGAPEDCFTTCLK